MKTSPTKQIITPIITLLIGLLLGFLSFSFFAHKSPSLINREDYSSAQNFSRFSDILWLLESAYYDTGKIHTGKMMQNAVKAYVDALDDPYTIYMDADQNSGFKEELKGNTDIEGIGAMIAKKEYYILIEEVIKDSPAYKAELIPLDRIIMINTWSTKLLTVTEAVNKIRGPKGTKVSLTIERIDKKWDKQLIKKEVSRDTLNFPSVTSKILSGKNSTNIGYMAISIIGSETEELFKTELTQIKEHHLKGIILDLRGNGGGFLPIASEIASHFIPSGELVVSAKYGNITEPLYAENIDKENIPLVILVDGMTASAGEIIALALKEQAGATIMGTQTFGKGSIQTVENFDDGTSLKYTVGKRYSPNDRNIDKIGITPDIIVPFDAINYKKTGKDNQLQKALELYK